jgi:transcriptional regulator with XRE-family HTH domain
MVDLGEQLREAIRRSGLNRKQVADRAGVAYCAIHGFMSGERGLTLDSASKVAELLGLELRPTKRRARQGKTQGDGR